MCLAGFGFATGFAGDPRPAPPPAATPTGVMIPMLPTVPLPNGFRTIEFGAPPLEALEDFAAVGVASASAGTFDPPCGLKSFGTPGSESEWPVASTQRYSEATRPAPNAPKLSPKAIRPPTKGQEYDRLSPGSIKHS